jgi:hypothetical protein
MHTQIYVSTSVLPGGAGDAGQWCPETTGATRPIPEFAAAQDEEQLAGQDFLVSLDVTPPTLGRC